MRRRRRCRLAKAALADDHDEVTLPAPPQPPTPDFRALFEAAPDPYLALAPDLTVVAASDAYLRATGIERAQIVGRGLPDLLNGGREEGFGGALCASLDRVVESRRADALNVQGYGLGAAGSGVWSGALRLVNAPVYGAEGEVAYVLHRVEPGSEEGEREAAAGERGDARFLAGLAHDLRNPLAPIVNSFQHSGIRSLEFT